MMNFGRGGEIVAVGHGAQAQPLCLLLPRRLLSKRRRRRLKDTVKRVQASAPLQVQNYNVLCATYARKVINCTLLLIIARYYTLLHFKVVKASAHPT